MSASGLRRLLASWSLSGSLHSPWLAIRFPGSCMTYFRLTPVIAGLFSLLAVGCGGDRATVSGTVTIAGAPVTSGAIAFEPADGKGVAVGGVITDGRYTVGGAQDVAPGKKTVLITAVQKTGKQVPAAPPAAPGTMIEEIKTVTSPPQAVEVIAGKSNEFSFSIP